MKLTIDGIKNRTAWEKIETMFREMLAGPGAVRVTIHKYIG